MITKELKKRIITSAILLIMTLLFILSNFFLAYCLIILGTISILEFLNIIKKINDNKFIILSTSILFSLYVFIFSGFFFYFSTFLQLKLIIFSILFTCIASDIGGFVFGNVFKGPKLTKISPKKTISGSVGSIIFATVIFTFSMFYFTKSISLKIIAVAIIISIANQIGDLIFSYLKRRANMKNTGNLLPGHGGILDRLDGILVGLPIGILALILIH